MDCSCLKEKSEVRFVWVIAAGWWAWAAGSGSRRRLLVGVGVAGGGCLAWGEAGGLWLGGCLKPMVAGVAGGGRLACGEAWGIWWGAHNG